MKKVLSIILSVTLVLMMVGCGKAESNTSNNASMPKSNSSETKSKEKEQPNITLKLGFSTNEEDPRAIAAKQFKKEIEEKTDNALTVEIYPSGQLGGDASLIEAMALDSGTVDIIITDASNFATYEPKMGISALPFQFETFEDAWDFMDSEVQAEAEATLIDHNMRVLAHYDNGFRSVTSNSPVNSSDDMTGMLIRTPENPVIMATMKALGANPQPLAFSELYMALQQGTYDAQENPVPVIYNNNLYEVQSHLAITNHIYSGMCFTFAENTWNKLSAEQQEIVKAAAIASQETNRKLNKQMTEDFLSELEAEGMTVTRPDLTPFVEASQSVYEELADSYGDLLDKAAEWKKNR